jgi:hypothetical protein
MWLLLVPTPTHPHHQVIAVICVLVWVMNINRFSDPALGGWMQGEWAARVCVCALSLLLGRVVAAVCG